MARADLLVTLVQAANRGNHALVQKTVEAIAAEERAKHHTVLAEQLEREIQQNPNGNGLKNAGLQSSHSKVYEVLFESTAQRRISDLVLGNAVRGAITDLVQEHHRADLLRSSNLQPRNRILLTGPPGNGKTSLAEALATELIVPLLTARYEGLITSFLGETAARLRQLFDFARTRRCVLFFDEFDTLGKERGDVHETGEIKRVVSSLLLQIDDLPSHTVVVAATNHPELLDRAVWRRFQLSLNLGAPSQRQVEEYLDLLLSKMNLKLGHRTRTLAEKMFGASFSELEDFMTDVARAYVLNLPAADLRSIISAKLPIWKGQLANKPSASRTTK